MELACDDEYEVAVVGEGSMADLLVSKLLNAGVLVNIYRAKSEADASIPGLRCHASLISICRTSTTVISVLPDGPMLEKILFGNEGVTRFCSTGTVIIDMSSVSPELIQEISEQLVELEMFFLDSVVLNEDNSDSDFIHMMLFGGDQYAYEKVHPIFQRIARNIKHIGVNGASQFYRQAFAVRAKT